MSSILDMLPWWGWLLCALGLRLVSWFFSVLYEGAKYARRTSEFERTCERVLAITFLVAAAACAIVGLVGLARTAWSFYKVVGPVALVWNWPRCAVRLGGRRMGLGQARLLPRVSSSGVSQSLINQNPPRPKSRAVSLCEPLTLA